MLIKGRASCHSTTRYPERRGRARRDGTCYPTFSATRSRHRIFSEQATVGSWLAAEQALAVAQAHHGVISGGEADSIVGLDAAATIQLEDMWRQTRNVGYPILPLVRMMAAALPPGADGRAHYGATTQDIMDTGLVLQLVAALERLSQLVDNFGNALAVHVDRHAGTVMAARTHGQQALPTTFGAKLASNLGECARHRERITEARPRVAVVSLYGGAGTSAALGPKAAEVRATMAEHLGLSSDDIPWHVARDRLAEFGTLCAMLAATAGRFAREVIELSRTEIREVAEAAGHHRGASSTMPQKQNPIGSEVVVGMAGVADALASSLFTAMRPTHERSAGEWLSEWFVVPSLAAMAAGALYNVGSVASGLQVFPERMQANLALGNGFVLAEAYMMSLAPVLGREQGPRPCVRGG